MLSGIELYNWKTHSQTKLSFRKGVNVLIGIMGAGKSSVMDAICFALYGTYPALKQRRLKLENAIKNRPKKEDEAEVRLSFLMGSDSYAVTRRFSSSGSALARLEKNGECLQTQPQRVNEEICGLLKVDYDTFTKAIYAEQNGIDYFLSIPKGDRKKQIDGMLGLDHFSTAEENCTSLINNLKSMISDGEKMLSGMDVASLKKQLEKDAAEKEAIVEAQEGLKAQYEKQSKLHKGLTSKIEEQRKAYRRKEELSRQLIEIGGKLQILKAETEKIDSATKGIDAAGLKNESASSGAGERQLREAIVEGERREKELLKVASVLEALLSNDRKRAQERDILLAQLKGKDPASLKRALEEHNSTLAELINIEAEARSRLSDIDLYMKELKKHLAKCPVCERELDDALRSKLMAIKDGEMRALKSSADESSKAISEKRSAIKRLDDERASLELAASRLKDYLNMDDAVKANSAKLKSVDKEAAELADALKRAKSERESLLEKIQKLGAASELFKKRLEHEADLKRYSELAEKSRIEVDSIKVSQDEMDFLQDSLAKESATLANLGAVVTGNDRQIATLDSGISSLVKQIDGIRELEQRAESRRSLVKSLNLFKSALTETAAMLRTRLIRSINSLLQSIWPEIYPYEDYTGLRLEARPDDYLLESCISIGGTEEWVPVDATASGGERSIACLAMRIALSMVIVPNLRWLILDEPTHNVDSNGIAKLISVLSDALPRVVEQVFIITHDDSLKQIASAKIYQFDRDKAAGGSTVVTEL